ncbi:glutamate-cysteine ligase family protein [Legionella londiniensis]|uniref:Glutamate--cysteine ligase, GCS2 n=1 Tax=Legionella londiniensis TaxID=45068 RepID=A0A0W0VT47_9GAMM|nr:glutamate-cysteine ligase family protein [Legionella londiniensis]KTD23323.1 Glutamate--cysteine ligase, GCS2 [Legionella londiniensis]STX94122.1 Glutamate--cysteine ligase, GCS2 [Legionella londiniensis]
MSNYPLFSVMGIEIEYMLVDKETLNVKPQSDAILNLLAGWQANEISLGDIAVSNELVLHVLELKNSGPKPIGAPISAHFQEAILKLQPLLAEYNLLLLPSGAHPWMDPRVETRRWPHGNQEIYQQYDRVFGCSGHGWSNLQSMHVNLPFANDEEFCQLHNAIRLILPLLPALAASTPFLDGEITGFQDSRLLYYGKNQQRIPSISGDIIPEFIHSQSQYEHEILKPMYRDISRYDPEGILQHEWLNSRGAIAKFEMMAIEIRLLDTQECVQADIAIAHLVFAILKKWHCDSHLYLEDPFDTKKLKALFEQSIKDGLSVTVDDGFLLEQWQLPKRTMTMRDIWSSLIESVSTELDEKSQLALEHILRFGNLSERILKACKNNHNRSTLAHVYRQLSQCLLNNQLFY